MKILFIFIISFALFNINNIAKADYCYTVAQGNGADGSNGTTEMNTRIMSETNAMAGTMCILMGFLTSDITKVILAFVLVVMGFGAYMGKLNLGLIVSFTLGVGMMFAIPVIFNLMSPYSNVGAGCDCKRHVIIGYSDGSSGLGPVGYGELPKGGSPGYIWQDLGLKPNCETMSSVSAGC